MDILGLAPVDIQNKVLAAVDKYLPERDEEVEYDNEEDEF
jgi:hypothetical protein